MAKQKEQRRKTGWSRSAALLYKRIPFKDSFAIFPLLTIATNIALAGLLSRFTVESNSELVKQAASMGTLITSAAISIVTITFSVTVVSVQIASQTYTPRLLEDFLKDPISKSVLSINVGAYAYCYTLIYFLDSSESEKTVPYVAIHFLSVQMLLVLLSFVSFVHFFVNGFRIENILQKAHTGSMRAAEALTAEYDDTDNQPKIPTVPYEATYKVMADKSGYVTEFYLKLIVDKAQDLDVCIRFCHQVGDYVNRGTVVCHVWDAGTRNNSKLDLKLKKRAVQGLPEPPSEGEDSNQDLSLERRAERRLGIFCNKGIHISPHRNGELDVTLGIQQLVDIAVRALSPGVNDPQTAIQCMDVLTSLLGTIASMEFNTPCAQDSDGVVRAFVPRRSFAFLLSMMEPIRQYGGKDLTVCRRAIRLFGDIGGILSRNKRHKRITGCLAQMEQWMRVAAENFDKKSVEMHSLRQLYKHEVRLIAESEQIKLEGSPGAQDMQVFATTYKDSDDDDDESLQDDIEASVVMGYLKDAIHGDTDVKEIHNMNNNNTFISDVMDKFKAK